MLAIVASLLRRGEYEKAEKKSFRLGVDYMEFSELVKRFYTGEMPGHMKG